MENAEGAALTWSGSIALICPGVCNNVHACADQAEKENLFSQLTEAAGELMNLGFEDIYQDTKAKIEATLGE